MLSNIAFRRFSQSWTDYEMIVPENATEIWTYAPTKVKLSLTENSID